MKLIANLFKKKQKIPAEKPEVDIPIEDIPRYPPFAKGLPSVSVEKLLTSQEEMITKMFWSLQCSKEYFDQFVMPLITSYARFVHLLPASQNHHHRGAGGLFRHSLEVAETCARVSGSKLFDKDRFGLERTEREKRWRLAFLTAGLLHDCGKPHTDVRITNRDGSKCWNSVELPLSDWLSREELDNFYISWVDGRGKNHESVASGVAKGIIPHHVQVHLSERGDDIYDEIFSALSGSGVKGRITRVMIDADSSSVSRDISLNNLQVDTFAYGVPVVRFVVDAIIRLVNSRVWEINGPGAKIWHTTGGTYIVWKAAVTDIFKMLDKDNTPGIPRDPDTLAEEMIERGYAMPQPVDSDDDTSSEHYLYWPFTPTVELEDDSVAGGVGTLMGLRIEDPDALFKRGMPKLVAVVEARKNQHSQSEQANADPAGGANIQSESDAKDRREDSPEEIAAQPTLRAQSADTSDIAPQSVSKPTDKADTVKGIGSTASATTDNTVESKAPAPDTAVLNSLNDKLNSMGMLSVFDTEDEGSGSAKTEDQREGPSGATEGASQVQKGERGDKQPAESVANVNARLNAPKKAPMPGNKKSPPNKHEPSPEDVPLGLSGDQGQQTNNTGAHAGKAPLTEDLRSELNRILESYAEAGQIIKLAVDEVIAGNSLLGETIILVDKAILLQYPEGAAKLGDSAVAVLKLLQEHNCIESDPVYNRAVQEVSGFTGLKLVDKIAKPAVSLFRQIEQELGLSEVAGQPPTDVSNKPDQHNNGKSKQKSNNKKASKKRERKAGAKPVAQTHKKRTQEGSPDQKPLFNEMSHRVDSGNTLDGTTQEPTGQTGNVFQEYEQVAVKARYARKKPKKKAPTVEKVSKAKNDATNLGVDAEIPPKKPSLKKPSPSNFDDNDLAVQCIKELALQVVNRQGRWIVGDIKQDGNDLMVSRLCLDKICAEHSALSISELKNAIKVYSRRNDGYECLLMKKWLVITP